MLFERDSDDGVMGFTRNAEIPAEPTGRITGDKLVEKTAKILSGARYGRLGPESPEMAFVRRLVTQIQPGTRVLRFEVQGYVDDEPVMRPRDGGVVVSEPYLVPLQYINDWAIRMDLPDPYGVDGVRQLSFSLEILAQPSRFEPFPDIEIGDEAIIARLDTFGLYSLARGEVGVAEVDDDIALLNAIQRCGVPQSFLGMTDEELSHVADRVVGNMLRADRSRSAFSTTLQVAEYLLDVQDDEGRLALRESVLQDIASRLPIDGTHGTGRLIDIVSRIHDGWPPSPSLPELSAAPTEKMRIAARLADLYAMRAEWLAEIPEVATEEPQNEPIALPYVPAESDYGKLAVLSMSFPSNKQIRADLAHLTFLRAHDVPVSVLGRDYDSMVTAVNNLMKFGMHQANEDERRELIVNLPYLFDIQRPPQREYLFELLCKRLANRVPMADDEALTRDYVRFVRTFADYLPDPPRDANGNMLSSDARTALLMADLYRLYVEHRFRLEYGHNPEDDETPSTTGAAHYQEDSYAQTPPSIL